MKGRVTIRTAAVFFALSAALEVVAIAVPVPLLGALRTGATAAAYHLAFAAIFLGVGVGLWTAARWGARVVYMATLIYTLDNVRYLLDVTGREAELVHQLRDYPEVIDTFGVEILLRVASVLTLLFVGCWWGFAAYIYWRRRYFQPE